MRITIERNQTPQIMHTTNHLYNFDQMVETEQGIFLTEGVCTNGIITPEDAVKEIECSGIEHMQRKYKGTWVVAYYDKQNRKVYVSNDLLSKKVIFYYCSPSLIVVDTSFFDLCAALREKGVMPQINQAAVEQMCTEGVLEGSITYEQSTKWLFPYMALKIDVDAFAIEETALQIPRMKLESEQDKNSIAHTLEDLFSKACRQQWDLNREAGADQVATLSGGMDSRATVYHMMKYAREENTPVYTFTYAQTNSLDESIPTKLAKQIGAEHGFIALDDCSFLWKRDKIIRNNEGQTHYAGTTGAVLMMERVREENKPRIVHTGIGGGNILGDIYKTKYDTEIIDFGPLTMTRNQWRNLNDLRVCPAFHWTTSDTCFALSPFLDEDFFEYCMCLPTRWKLGRRLYDEWYREYMDTGVGIANTRNHIGNQNPVGNFVRHALRKVSKLTNRKTKYDMNPFSYWYAQNEKLRKFLEDEYSKDTDALKEAGVDTQYIEAYWKDDLSAREKVLTATYVCLTMLGIYG